MDITRGAAMIETILKCLRSIFLNVSGSQDDYFPSPQRRLTRFLWVVLQFRVQRSCKIITRITKQSLKSPGISSRDFSSRQTEVPICLREWVCCAYKIKSYPLHFLHYYNLLRKLKVNFLLSTDYLLHHWKSHNDNCTSIK